jgi:hypothetical protein
MKILAIEKDIPGIKADDYKPHLKAEALQAWQLYKQGSIRELYFTQDYYAVLILECNNESEAREILNSLPLVKEKLIDFNIIPLIPYDGFERLFK